jgi:hypothetical protein
VTIILVLGLFAGLYMLWLLFSLTTHALPLYVGLAFGLWFYRHGLSLAGSILAGFLAAITTMVAGPLLFALVRSPTLRLLVVLLFVLPAGFAGYQVVYGLAGLAIAKGVALTALSVIGGCAIARAAWKSVTNPSQDVRVPAVS